MIFAAFLGLDAQKCFRKNNDSPTLLDQVGLIDALSVAVAGKLDIVSARALNKHMRLQVLQEAAPL